MIIVGLTGKIDSGKTTFAALLARHVAHSQQWESWQVVAQIANQLKNQSFSPAPDDPGAITVWLQILPELVSQVTHTGLNADDAIVTAEKMVAAPEEYVKLTDYLRAVGAQPELREQPITDQTKETFRNLLQWVGGYLVLKTDDGIWYDEILRRIDQTADLELATITGVRFPGEAHRIQAKGGVIVRLERPNIAGRDSNDLTERESALIASDLTIINDGSLEQLERCADKVWSDLRAGKLETNYRATSF